MLSATAIAGVGETQYARRIDSSVLELVIQAARLAIADAGLDPQDIDGFVTSPGQPALDEVAVMLGATNRSFSAQTTFVAGGASVGGLQLARLAIENKLARNVLISYGIKTSRPGGPYAYHETDSRKADLEMPFGFYGQPVYFAAIANRYKHEYGLTFEQLGAIAVAARQWARRTPGAQAQDEMTIDDYLAAPFIANPLRKPDCCLMSDGAAAYVVTALDAARDLPNPPAVIRGVGLGSLPITMSEIFTQSPDYLATPAKKSAEMAYDDAGLKPDDVDFAEIYDCFTPSVIRQIEDLGFCDRGEGASFVDEGRIAPGGALPVNTHGGHLSHAYIPGANHVVEAVRQLRGTRGDAQVPDANVGIVAGMSASDHATAILSRDL